MKLIPLTQGLHSQVDDDLFDELSAHKWLARVSRKGQSVYYAARWEIRDGKKVFIYMHRQIMGFPHSVDHIDRDGLNNQRRNLRACTHAENMQNRTYSLTGSMGTHRKGNRWTSEIYVNKKRTRLGSFSTREEANAAYLEAKARMHIDNA